ncbi:MAG: hypothetical protein A2204_01030 [Elusimicrobia bacterium RIFOXYA1_FULL_47_7]|nr:MAG: hypothetical protein A2204_01030 [Elusimicrobia bacterium RIFOXYA1_FULL_47_7]
MKNKKAYAVAASEDMIKWSKQTLPAYQLNFSSFVERCYLMFERNKEFRNLLLIKYYEEIENVRSITSADLQDNKSDQQ